MDTGNVLRQFAENRLRDESMLTFFSLGCYNIVGGTVIIWRPFSVMGHQKGKVRKMYQVDDLIVYGNHGVCRVAEVGTPKVPVADRNRQYYTLRPAYQREQVIYAPVDNNKTVMRPILTKQEADDLIEEIPKLNTVWIASEKEREAQYKATIRTCDCKELVRMIKTLYERKRERVQSGKKVPVVDERYFHQAEEQLCGELAIVLKIPKEEVSGYIAECAKLSQDCND